LARFAREAKVLASLNNPHIGGIYGVEEADDVRALVLELVEGPTLADHIRRAPIPVDEALPIARQIAEALEAAHERGIIHRDLKPANIMYDHETQTARLLDFGIARDAEDNPADRLTRAGFFVGTLQYVAPEALSGELVGEQADVYSLATIAYHLLTGVLPFPGKSPRELFQQLLTQSPVPLNEAVKGLKFGPAIEGAVMTGLERDLSKRWKTVSDFANAFCAAAGDDAPGKKAGFFSSLFRRSGE